MNNYNNSFMIIIFGYPLIVNLYKHKVYITNNITLVRESLLSKFCVINIIIYVSGNR